jgi:hypothetical protein
MTFAITTLLILSSFDVYYFLLKFHALIVSPLKYILCMDSKYFAIVMDETTDASCKEQVSVCLRYVSDDLQVHEIFTGFYETPDTTASTMFEIAQDVLTRFELPLVNCRGHCFDGASNMSGKIQVCRKESVTFSQRRYLYTA